MTHQQLRKSSRNSVCCIGFLVSLFLGASDIYIPVHADAFPKSPQINPRKGTPRGKKKPGGTYPASCQKVANELTVLLENKNSDFTASDISDFNLWFYIPYEKQGSIEIALSDERNIKSILSPVVVKIDRPGMIKIDLSEHKKAFALNTNYRWTFKFYCTSDKSRGPNKTMEGWVQKVQGTQSSNFAYDRINRITSSYFSSSGDSQNWRELLEELGSSELINAPLAIGN